MNFQNLDRVPGNLCDSIQFSYEQSIAKQIPRSGNAYAVSDLKF